MAGPGVGEVVEVVQEGEVFGLERLGLGAVERRHRLDVGDRGAEHGDGHPRMLGPVAGEAGDLAEDLRRDPPEADPLAAAREQRRAEAGPVPAPGAFEVAVVLEPARLDPGDAEPRAVILVDRDRPPARDDRVDRHRVGALGPPEPHLHRRPVLLDPVERLRLLLERLPRPHPHVHEDVALPLAAEHGEGPGEQHGRVLVVGDRLGPVGRDVERLGRVGDAPEACHAEHAQGQRDDDRQSQREPEQSAPPPPPREDRDLIRTRLDRAHREALRRIGLRFSDKCRSTECAASTNPFGGRESV